MVAWPDAPKHIRAILRSAVYAGSIASLISLLSIGMDFYLKVREVEVERARQEALLVQQRALAAEAQRRAAEADAATNTIRSTSEADERRARDARADDARRQEQARRDSVEQQQRRDLDARAQRLDDQRRAADAKRALDQRRADELEQQRRADQQLADRAFAGCRRCCDQRAPGFNPKYNPSQAVSICMEECISGKPSNWFVNNAVLCRP